MPVGIADCCAGGESCRALGCGRDERGKLKSCEGELKSRGCSVPSTSCVGEGLSVPVCIADGCAGGESGRTLGCGRDDRGELRSCEGELSCFRGGELGFECTVSPRSSVCGDVSVARTLKWVLARAQLLEHLRQVLEQLASWTVLTPGWPIAARTF